MTVDVKLLASYRVRAPEHLDYHSRAMTADEISARRAYIRNTLRNMPQWCNLPNEQIDQILLKSSDRGYLVEDCNGYEFLLPLSKVSSSETAIRKEYAMIPFEFMNLTGKDFDWGKYTADISSVKDLVSKYIVSYQRFKSSGMGLYIYSSAKGSGKTMLACCLLNEITKRYFGTVKFINVLDFLELVKKASSEGDTLQQLYMANLLVIDDIGVQSSKEWSDAALYRLINDRYANKRPTIYTSNTPIDSLNVDERVRDRIDSTTYVVKLPEESIRKRERQQEKKELLDSMKNALR